MNLSVFILTRGRLELLKDCWKTVAAALPPMSEVVLVINGLNDPAGSWAAAQNHPALRWYQIPEVGRAEARNFAFSLCRGDVIYFLDDDVTVPPHLFVKAIEKFKLDSELAILGGPNLTPTSSPWIESLFGAIMTSGFAAPWVRSRYSKVKLIKEGAATERDLILCNLAVRPSRIPESFRFKERMKSNEENLLIFRTRQMGAKIEHSHSLYVFHRRRGDLISFSHQIFAYGWGRAEQTVLAPRSLHPAFLVPSLVFVVSLLLLSYPAAYPCFFGLALVHGLFSLLASWRAPEIRRLGGRALFASVGLTAFIHFTYGAGFLIGLTRSIQNTVKTHLARWGQRSSSRFRTEKERLLNA